MYIQFCVLYWRLMVSVLVVSVTARDWEQWKDVVEKSMTGNRQRTMAWHNSVACCLFRGHKWQSEQKYVEPQQQLRLEQQRRRLSRLAAERQHEPEIRLFARLRLSTAVKSNLQSCRHDRHGSAQMPRASCKRFQVWKWVFFTFLSPPNVWLSANLQ